MAFWNHQLLVPWFYMQLLLSRDTLMRPKQQTPVLTDQGFCSIWLGGWGFHEGRAWDKELDMSGFIVFWGGNLWKQIWESSEWYRAGGKCALPMLLLGNQEFKYVGTCEMPTQAPRIIQKDKAFILPSLIESVGSSPLLGCTCRQSKGAPMTP